MIDIRDKDDNLGAYITNWQSLSTHKELVLNLSSIRKDREKVLIVTDILYNDIYMKLRVNEIKLFLELLFNF